MLPCTPYVATYSTNMLLRYTSLNVYCPECPPGGTIGHPGGQQKEFLPFGHGMDLAAFKGTDIQNKSLQDWAEISKA